MKKIQMLFHQDGENAGTLGILREYIAANEPQGLLEETCVKFRHWDDDHQVEVKKYSVIEYTIPDWMDGHFLAQHFTDVRWVLHFGFDLEWSKEWFWDFKEFNDLQKLIYSKLARYKGKSEFQGKLRDQFLEWINAPRKDRKYSSPLSPAQFGCLTQYGRPDLTAKSMSNYLYSSNRYGW